MNKHKFSARALREVALLSSLLVAYIGCAYLTAVTARSYSALSFQVKAVDAATGNPKSSFYLGETIAVSFTVTNQSAAAQTITELELMEIPVTLSIAPNRSDATSTRRATRGGTGRMSQGAPGVAFWYNVPKQSTNLAPGQAVSVKISDVGRFFAMTLDDGSYTLNATFNGTLQAQTTFTVVIDQANSVPLLEQLAASQDDADRGWANGYLDLIRKPSISGTITTAGGVPLGGVALDVTGSETVHVETRADGKYEITRLTVGGSYTLTPSLDKYTFEPIRQSFTNLMSTQAGVNFTATRVLSGVNVASSDAGAAATASSTSSEDDYPTESVIDGVTSGSGWGRGSGGWQDGTPNAFPDWIEINFGAVKAIDWINVYTLQDNNAIAVEPTLSQTFAQYGITDFDVQYWDGGAWVNVPGGVVNGNMNVWRKFSFPTINTSKIRVFVRGALGGQSRITEIEAFHANVPPTVSITGTYEGALGATFQFGSNAADSDGSISSYDWDFGDGTFSTGSNPSHTYLTAGIFTVSLVVTDDGGETAKATRTVTITEPPQAPIASAGGPYEGVAGAVIFFEGRGSYDPDGTITAYQWNFGDNTSSTGSAPEHAYAQPGIYVVTLTVTDNSGSTGTQTAVATIGTTPQSPPAVSIIAPASGADFTAPASISINATASDTDGSISKVEFFQGSTKLGEDSTAPYSFVWASVGAGSYSLTASATDNQGASTTSAAVSITVSNGNVAPTIAITSPTSGTVFTPPASVSINATASDSDGSISKVEFFQSSTKLGEDLNAPYSFAWTNVAAGSYSLTAKATDNLGATTTSGAVSITVNQPPVANAGGQYSGTAGIAVQFNGGGSSDPDGSIASYSWNFGDGGTASGIAPAHPYTTAGNYIATLTVTDNNGGQASATASVNISNGGGNTNGYINRRSITVDHTKVPSTDQAGFPVLISGTYSYLATTANGGNVRHANGYDIIFTSDFGCANKLSHEVETYNATSGAVNYWVKVPTLSSTSDTVIYMCYGNSSITSDQSNKTAVWDSSYKGVWHLPNGTTLSAADSTANANHGAISGPIATTGRIDGGSSSVNGADHINAGSGSSLNITGNLTITAWIKMNSLGINGRSPIVYRATQTTDGYNFLVGGDSVSSKFIGFGPKSNGNIAIVQNVIDVGAWYHVVVVSNGANPTFYVNGANVGTGTPIVSNPSSGSLHIGNYPSLVRGFDGIIDEVRISNTQRTAEWIATEYNNQSSPATFYTISAASVSNQSPVANAGASYSGTAGTAVQFNGGGSYDPDGSIAAYSWNFGDGGTASGVAPTHTYAAAGNYTATLTVTDNSGAQASASAAVTINPALPAMSATFVSQTVPTTSMTAGLSYGVSVTMRNTGSNTWTSPNLYRLGSQNPQDNGIWSIGRVELPATVAPGSQASFNFTVRAPSTAGTYNFQWRMLQEAVAWFGDFTPNTVITVANAPASGDTVWVEDAVPAGAIVAGDGEGWNWIGSSPTPQSGSLSHQSNLVNGLHQHYFYNATNALFVGTGDKLFAYVYLDPVNPPSEVVLQWNDGSWEHRAYWGANNIIWGIDGTDSRRYMGALPAAGGWAYLEVAASAVGLEGRTLNGMAFSLCNGRATWDRAGKRSGISRVNVTTSNVMGPTISVAKPANLVSGDVLVAIIASSFAYGGVPTPAGWTLIRSVDQGSQIIHVDTYYRVVDGSEPAAWTWQLGSPNGNVNARTTASIIGYRGLNTTTPIGPTNTNCCTPGTSTSVGSINTLTADNLILEIFAEGQSDSLYTAPAGLTGVMNVTNSDPNWGNHHMFGERLLASAGPTGDRIATNGKDTGSDVAQLIALQPSSASPGNTNGYAYRRSITIDHNKVANTDQSNFPLLVSGTYSYLATAANGGNLQNQNGYDVVFTSDSGCANKLNHEVETYSAATGAVNYWVKVPTVSHTSDTIVYICYGNPAISTPQENTTGVWDANFKSVFHLKDGISLNVTDSTGNHNLTNNGATATSGLAGGGGAFDGSTQYLGITDHSDFAWINLRTVEFWMKLGNSTQTLPRIISHSDGSADGWSINWIDPPSAAGSGWAGNFLVASIGTQPVPSIQKQTPDNGTLNASGAWHHVAVIGDGNAVAAIYVDGSLVTLSNYVGNIANTTVSGLNIGRRNNGARYFNGSLDELRFSNAQRSTDWIKTEYNNQSSPATFYSVSASSGGAPLPTVYRASTDFSSVQGQQNWYYLESTGAQFVFLNQWGGVWQVPNTSAYLGSWWGHPGDAGDAVRQWRAPGGGSIRITGNAYDSDPGGGDGVLVSIKKGTQLLWERTIENGDANGFSYDVTTNVVAGDQINFVINRRSNTYWDSTAFDPTITYSSGGSGSSSANVIWTNVSNTVQANGNSLAKVSGTTSWDAGAVSTQTISGNGYVEFTPGNTTTWRMCGLGNSDSSTSYPDIEYAFYLEGGSNLYIYESGNYRGAFGSYADTDRLKVAAEGGIVKYYKNGTLLYTSTVTAQFPLLVDTSLYSVNPSVNALSNVVISSGG
jgi:PKD repeat protein